MTTTIKLIDKDDMYTMEAFRIWLESSKGTEGKCLGTLEHRDNEFSPVFNWENAQLDFTLKEWSIINSVVLKTNRKRVTLKFDL